MGLILNPIGHRIGHLKSWSDAWYMHRMYYPIFLHNVFLIKTLLNYLLFRFFPSKKSKWVYSHSNIYIYMNKIFLSVYIYVGYGSYLWTSLSKKFKWQEFTNLRLRSSWLKRKLVNWNKLGIRFLLILTTLNLHIDVLGLEDLQVKYNKYTIKQILHLKKKYSTKTKPFIAVEQIWLIEKMLLILRQFFDKFGSSFLLKHYNKYFRWISFFKNIKINKKEEENYFILQKKDKIKRIRKIRSNYIFLFYVISFINLLLASSTRRYPFSVISRRGYSFVLSKYISWFLYRSIFNIFKKYIEVFILYFGFSVFAKMFILDNASVNATFVSRYISRIVRKKNFQLKDLMIPLKKMLGKLMFISSRKKLNRKNILFQKKNKNVNLYKNYLKYIYLYLYKIYYIKIWTQLNDLKNKFYFFKWRVILLIHYKKNKKFYRPNKLLFFNFDKIINIIKNKYNLFFIFFYKYKFNLLKLKNNNYKKIYLFNLNIKKKKFNLKQLKNFFLLKLLKLIKNIYLILNFNNKFNNKIFIKLKLIQNNLLFYNHNIKIKLNLLVHFGFIYLIKNNFFNQKIILFLKNYYLNLNFFNNLIEYFIKFDLFYYINKDISIRLYHYLKNYKKFIYKLKTFKKWFKRKIRKVYTYNAVKLNHIYWSLHKGIYKSKYLKKNEQKLVNYLKNKKKYNKRLRNRILINKYTKTKFISRNKFYYNFFLKKKKKLYFLNFWKKFHREYKNELKISFSHEKYKKIRALIKYWSIFFKLNYEKRFFIYNNLKSLKNLSKKQREYLNFYKKTLLIKNKFEKNYYLLKNNNLKLKKFKKNRYNRYNKININKNKKHKQMWQYSLELKKLNKKKHFLIFECYKMNYKYFFMFRQYYNFKDFFIYHPFHYNLNQFKNYLFKLKYFKAYYDQSYLNLLNKNLLNDKNLLFSPLKKKKEKQRLFLNNYNNKIIIGYKFEFSGRFTRKQRATKLWYLRGLNPLSSMNQFVEMGFHTMNLKYGTCSIKVWICKTENAPTFFIRFA